MKILALDIAETTGWATNNESGSILLKSNKGESDGIKIIRFKKWIVGKIKETQPDIVVYEKPSGRFIKSVISINQKIGVLLEYLEENNIKYTSYTVGEIKKHAGNGNANKGYMLKMAQQMFKKNVVDDNEADALFLHDLTKTQLT